MGIDTTKSKQILSSALLSGSRDALRTAIGGHWDFVSSSKGSTYIYTSFSSLDPSTGYFDKISSNVSEGSVETISATALMLNRKFPVRIFGNEESVVNDNMWKTLFLGGTFDEGSYGAIYNEQELEYFYTSWGEPYTAYESAQILSASGFVTEQTQITYNYNRYLSSYQTYADVVGSELQLPNYYLLSDLSTYDLSGDDADLFDKELIDFVTLENEYEDVSSVFTINKGALSAELGIRTAADLSARCTTDTGYDYSFLSTLYLTGTFPQVSLSASTMGYINNRTRNLLFDNEAMNKLYNEDQVAKNRKYFPYYVEINFPIEKQGDFGESIENNNFSSKFIKNLYMAFSGEDPALFVTNKNYMRLSSQYDVSSGPPSKLIYQEKANNAAFMSVDYPSFLANCRNTYSSSAERCLLVGEKNLYRDAAGGAYSGPLRYINTLTATGVISDMVTYFSSSANFNISSLADVYGRGEGIEETLAYRIEKRTASGKSLQDYWIWNPGKIVSAAGLSSDISFYDTQVKYDQEYKYIVYAYKLVEGFKYKYSDLILTKQIGCDTAEGIHGLEFYNPHTDERTEQLYDTEAGHLQSLNDLVTMAQTTSRYPYLADMYFNYEPTLQILQVPIFSKTLKITDNWPPKPHLRPYQIIDASQTVGFEVALGDHMNAKYLDGISVSDNADRDSYLSAKDLLPDEKVTTETISEQRYIEIYRITEKPTDVTAFDGQLLHTVDLKILNSNYSYTTGFFENIIKTNQKYYYLFRVLNELRVPGHLSDICEVELVNDGGYVYGVFNILTEADLEQESLRSVSRGVKKLLQLRPNINQTDFDNSNVDYSLNAGANMELLGVGTTGDLIWDKTFKIRLTSKKTGKKIDLNITYKLQSEY